MGLGGPYLEWAVLISAVRLSAMDEKVLEEGMILGGCRGWRAISLQPSVMNLWQRLCTMVRHSRHL